MSVDRGCNGRLQLPARPEGTAGVGADHEPEARAHEELIEAEVLAAERMAIRHPNGIEGRPGWLDAIAATLTWVWRGSGVLPLEIRRAEAG